MNANVALSYLPYTIDVDDLILHADGKLMLLDQEKILALQTTLQDQPDGRYSKSDLKMRGISNPQYGIIKEKENLYAVYHGKQQHKEAGSGSFGTVKFIQNLKTADFCVLKVIKSPDREVEKEIRHLASLNMLAFDSNHRSKENINERIIGMKLAQGKNLEKIIDEHTNFAPIQNLMIAKGMLKEVKDIHADKGSILKEVKDNHANKGNILKKIIKKVKDSHADKGRKENRIIHRDIKPSNFICDSTCRVKLIDYGLAINASGIDKEKGVFFNSNWTKGTQIFMAPEIINDRQYTEKSEIFALGISIAEIFNLNDTAQPYEKDGRSYGRVRIVNNDEPSFINNNLLPKDELSKKEILAFLKKMTAADPHDRPTIVESYQFFNQRYAKEFINGEMNVGVLSVKDFIQVASGKTMIDQHKVNLTINNLKIQNIHAIAFIDDTPRNQKEYLKLRKCFEKNGQDGIFNIAPIVQIGPKKEATKSVESYFQSYYQITPHIVPDKKLLPMAEKVKRSHEISQYAHCNARNKSSEKDTYANNPAQNESSEKDAYANHSVQSESSGKDTYANNPAQSKSSEKDIYANNPAQSKSSEKDTYANHPVQSETTKNDHSQKETTVSSKNLPRIGRH